MNPGSSEKQPSAVDIFDEEAPSYGSVWQMPREAARADQLEDGLEILGAMGFDARVEAGEDYCEAAPPPDWTFRRLQTDDPQIVEILDETKRPRILCFQSVFGGLPPLFRVLPDKVYAFGALYATPGVVYPTQRLHISQDFVVPKTFSFVRKMGGDPYVYLMRLDAEKAFCHTAHHSHLWEVDLATGRAVCVEPGEIDAPKNEVDVSSCELDALKRGCIAARTSYRQTLNNESVGSKPAHGPERLDGRGLSCPER